MLNLNDIQDESNGIYKDREIDWLLLTVMEMQKEENDKLRSAIHQLRTQCASLTASIQHLKRSLSPIAGKLAVLKIQPKN